MRGGICKIHAIYYCCLYFATILETDTQTSTPILSPTPTSTSTTSTNLPSKPSCTSNVPTADTTTSHTTSTMTSSSTTRKPVLTTSVTTLRTTLPPTTTKRPETDTPTSTPILSPTPISTSTTSANLPSKPRSTSNVPTTDTTTSHTTSTMTSSSTTKKPVLTKSVTTPQTTVRSTTTKRPEKNPCQNGGTWNADDNECNCPAPYKGAYCELLDDEIAVDEVEASVDVSLTITNQEFSPQLEDESSAEYKNFSRDFEDQMDIIYKTVEGYKGVKILKIRQGSIVVDHEVIIAMSSSEGVSEEVLNNKVENIKASLKNSSSAGGNNGFVFDNSSINVKKPILKDNCTALVPGNAGKYYKLVFTETKAVCVSICDSIRNDSMKCGNGMCGMTNNGPLCYCDMSQDYWYFGVHCDHAIHKNGLIAGLSVALIVLVLGLLAIATYNMKFRRTIKQFESKRDEQKKEIMEKWEDDDWEWSNSGSDVAIEKGIGNIDESIAEEESYAGSRSYMTSIPTGQLKIRRSEMNTYNFCNDV